MAIFDWAVRYIKNDNAAMREKLDAIDMKTASDLAETMAKMESDWEGTGSAYIWLTEAFVSLYPTITRAELAECLDFAASERIEEAMRLRKLFQAALNRTSYDTELLPNIQEQVHRVSERDQMLDE